MSALEWHTPPPTTSSFEARVPKATILMTVLRFIQLQAFLLAASFGVQGLDPRARTWCADSKVAFPPLLSNIVRRRRENAMMGKGGVFSLGMVEPAPSGTKRILTFL